MRPACWRLLGPVGDAELAAAHPGLAELAAWYEQVLISGDFSVAIIKDLQIFTIVSPASAVPAGYYLAVRNPVPGVLV